MDTPQLNERIEQWEKMAREAPDGMAYLSLGGAYREAERYEEAAGAFRKAIEFDPTLSRAYQLLAQAMIKAGADDQAGEVLTTGYTVAAEHGDVMPQRAMGELLKKLGLPVPEVEAHEPASEPAGEGEVVCRRTGRPGGRLTDPPLPGAVGRFIADHYCTQTWNEWIGQGTKVINELRLDFSNLNHQQIYEQQMLEWLGFTQEEAEAYAAEHAAD